MACPICPDDGYASVIVATDNSSPSGVSVSYVCWHGIKLEPPEWSLQARLTAQQHDPA
jgi:hypothetical protein